MLKQFKQRFWILITFSHSSNLLGNSDKVTPVILTLIGKSAEIRMIEFELLARTHPLLLCIRPIYGNVAHMNAHCKDLSVNAQVYELKIPTVVKRKEQRTTAQSFQDLPPISQHTMFT